MLSCFRSKKSKLTFDLFLGRTNEWNVVFWQGSELEPVLYCGGPDHQGGRQHRQHRQGRPHQAADHPPLGSAECHRWAKGGVGGGCRVQDHWPGYVAETAAGHPGAIRIFVEDAVSHHTDGCLDIWQTWKTISLRCVCRDWRCWPNCLWFRALLGLLPSYSRFKSFHKQLILSSLECSAAAVCSLQHCSTAPWTWATPTPRTENWNFILEYLNFNLKCTFILF